MKKRAVTDRELKQLEIYGLKKNDVAEPAVIEFESEEFLLREGDPIYDLYFVLSGKAKVCMDVANGKRYVLCYFVSNGIIGDLELMAGQTEAFATVQAVTNFTCIGIPLALNAPLLKRNISFLNHIGKELAYKLKQSDTNSAVTVLHTLEERLAAYIIQTAVNGVFCETLTDVASLLGASYRHLLRCLDKLCAGGILRKQKNGFVITDEAGLKGKVSELYKLDYLEK